MLTPEEGHSKPKPKPSRRRQDNDRLDPVKRTARVRRFFAQVRDHVRRVFNR